MDNGEWLRQLNLVEFMRDIGSRFSVNEVLRLEAYRARLEAGGLTFLEMSYVLMQSYDFLHLYQKHECILQVGGSDQWGNSIAGADLIRRVTSREAYVLVAPLLLTSEGKKMGKTEKGAVWLDSQRTSPYDYYQYWRNTDDGDVERYLAMFTFLPIDEVRSLAHVEGAELNRAKETLAFEATKVAHGEEQAIGARNAARVLFAGAEGGADVPTTAIPRERVEGGISVSELFKEAGLVASANEARSLIGQGGLFINGEAVSDVRARLEPPDGDGDFMLSRGRKRHMRVVFR
ncbi:MAG: tyrosine--tRNA ligase [Chloroflexi bacterium]|nr:MAG: tyrosine--tRNA ligase [Chloroflexota bacterium]